MVDPECCCLNSNNNSLFSHQLLYFNKGVEWYPLLYMSHSFTPGDDFFISFHSMNVYSYPNWSFIIITTPMSHEKVELEDELFTGRIFLNIFVGLILSPNEYMLPDQERRKEDQYLMHWMIKARKVSKLSYKELVIYWPMDSCILNWYWRVLSR